MMPDYATLYLSGIEDAEYKEEKIGYWENVYGFDYSCMKEVALREPLVDTVDVKAVVTKPCRVLELDLKTITKAELTFKAPFILEATRHDCEFLLAARGNIP